MFIDLRDNAIQSLRKIDEEVKIEIRYTGLDIPQLLNILCFCIMRIILLGINISSYAKEPLLDLPRPLAKNPLFHDRGELSPFFIEQKGGDEPSLCVQGLGEHIKGFPFSRVGYKSPILVSCPSKGRGLRVEKGMITEEEAARIRDKTSPEEGGVLISTKGAQIKLGGELELEFRDTQKDEGIAVSCARFQFDKFVLKPEVVLKGSNISLKGELKFTEDAFEFEQGGIYFKNLPLESVLFIGVEDRFCEAKRKTEGYPLLGTILWRYEYPQINWQASFTSPLDRSGVYWGISLGEGLKLGTKQPSEDSSYKMLADKRNIEDKEGKPELGFKLGLKQKMGKADLDFLGFGFWGKLGSSDISVLESKLPSYISSSDTMRRWGTRMVYNYKFDKLRKLTLVGEYAKLFDGALDRDGFYIQASCKWEFRRIYFCSFQPLIRYGRLNVDWEKSFSSPCSWDREALTLALITEIAKNVKLKTEYYFNDEDTGQRSVDNNEFLIQLEFKF
jgi:hypothetical protein